MEIKTVLAAAENFGGGRAASQIRYIIYHYTGNDGDHDEGNAAYYRDNVVKASAHYFVDDDSVTQSVPDLRVAWAVGGRKWSDCRQTGGGTMYGRITNTNSISIEMCDTSRDGRLMASAATQERALELGRLLMKRYGIPIDRVYRHFDVTGKHCPAYFMDTAAWNAFKARLEDDMTQEQFNKMFAAAMAEYEAEQARKPVAEWAREHQDWAMGQGITDGARPCATMTRQEEWTMAHRLFELVGRGDAPTINTAGHTSGI